MQKTRISLLGLLAAATIATGRQIKEAPPQPGAAQQRYEEIGKSAQGRVIGATVMGSGKKTALVIGGIHGDEISGSVLAKALAATLVREGGPPPGLRVVIIPEANPDGLFAATRFNGRGIDVNRNFPAKSWVRDIEDPQHNPGPEPSSEPETKALLGVIKKYSPGLILSFHAAMGCVNWDGPAEAYAQRLAAVNGYPLCGSIGYATPGSFGSYCGIDLHIPTITLELKAEDEGDLVKENIPALRYLFASFATETGPPTAIPAPGASPPSMPGANPMPTRTPPPGR